VHLTRPLRRLTAWIAALVMLMVALAPAISQAVGASDAKAWIEVCSTAGSRWIAADATPGDPPPQPSADHLLAHCPFCHIHVDQGVPAPANAQTLLLTGLGEARPAAFLQAPRTPHAWVSAQPRAPPAAA
jgi:Protein of unknown function (DUF2946)